MRRCWVAASGLLLGMMASGCAGGGEGPNRQAVSGTVTIDGQPLDEGQITFVPASGDGPAAGGTIANGLYAIGRADGPAPGLHKVGILSAKPTGVKIKDESDPSVTYDERAETIPEIYNSQTTLKAEVEAGGGNRFDFELKGRKNPAAARR